MFYNGLQCLWNRLFRCSPTFTLHALAKETLEQTLAVLADSGTSVGVNGEGVWHLDPSQHHLLHPDRPAAPGQDPLPCLLMGPLLRELEKKKRRIKNHMQEESEGNNRGTAGSIWVIGKESEWWYGSRRRERNPWKREKEICHTELAWLCVVNTIPVVEKRLLDLSCFTTYEHQVLILYEYIKQSGSSWQKWEAGFLHFWVSRYINISMALA